MEAQQTIDELLGYQGQLDYSECIPVLGIAIQFRSNNALAINNGCSTIRHWHQLPQHLVAENTGLTIEIIADDQPCGPGPDEYRFYNRVRDDVLLANHGRNLVCALRDRKAVAFVTPDLLQNAREIAGLVESLVYFLVGWTRRVPFHASAIARNGQAIAFVGGSGAGKSCLAYACLRKGFDLLSEDTIFLGTEADYRIWGNASRIHLLPDAARLFPELAGREPRLRHGKLKIAVPVSETGTGNAVLQAKSIIVCLVKPNHAHRDSQLQPIFPKMIKEEIISNLDPGFDLRPDLLPAALDRLLTRPAYSLSLGSDFDITTDLLLHLL